MQNHNYDVKEGKVESDTERGGTGGVNRTERGGNDK